MLPFGILITIAAVLSWVRPDYSGEYWTVAGVAAAMYLIALVIDRWKVIQ